MNSIKHKCRKHEESWKWWMINDEDEEGKRNATKSVRKRLRIVTTFSFQEKESDTILRR